MKKKICAAVCAALMALSLFACSGSDSGSQSSGSGSDTSTQSASGQGDKPEEKAPAIPTTLDKSVPSPQFSKDSGFYNTEFDLELTSSDPNAKIYYTLDGSDPNPASNLYTGPINMKNRSVEQDVLAAKKDTTAGDPFIPAFPVRKGNVIKAAVIRDDGTRGEILTRTYFVGVDREKNYPDVPVISIVTDAENLFNYETGIYVLGQKHDEWLAEDKKNKNLEGWRHQANFTQKGKEWERPVSVEFLETDGTTAFAQDMGLRILGGASRNHPQKSLKLIARDEYGKKNVKYEIIPGNMRSDGTGTVDKYKSFSLRDGGNDADFARIRDPLLQSLVSDRDLETMQFRPCIAFINGEYWGMYCLIEDYSDNYFSNNYDIDNKNVVLIKRSEVEDGEESDIELYTSMLEFINGNDMSKAENYDKACGMLDMQSFADYCAFEIYIDNSDCLFNNDNNWRMWRVREPVEGIMNADGKFRMVVYDTDFSTGIYNGGNGSRDSFLNSAMNGNNLKDDQMGKMLSSLCKNKDFLQIFANSLLDLRNVNFEKKRVKAAISEISKPYLALMNETYRRFGPAYIQDVDFLQGKITELQGYLLKRADNFPDIVKKNVGLGDLHQLILRTGEGTVQLNNSEIAAGTELYTKYLSDCPITLTAKAPEGKKFVRWDATGISLPDKTAETITVSVTADGELNAVFE